MMNYETRCITPYSSPGSSGYLGPPVQNSPYPHQPHSWPLPMPLMYLHDQKDYLEALLSKKATTLYALRDRQTRNHRALCTNSFERSKRKKIKHNIYITDQTIRICENEQEAILECLRVCQNNINALGSIVNPMEVWPGTVDYHWSACPSYVDSESTTRDFDWNGWIDEEETSPFQRRARRPAVVDEIPPEACTSATELAIRVPTSEEPRPPSPPSHDPLPPPPPNTAHPHLASSLSPEAASFEPKVTHDPPQNEHGAKKIDKLSISGMLASKRLRKLQLDRLRRFSDEAIGHLFHRLSGVARDGTAGAPARRRNASCGSQSLHCTVDSAGMAPVRRSVSA